MSSSRRLLSSPGSANYYFALYSYYRFAMEIEGIFYVAEVREKEEAWKKYKDAVEAGKTAGELSTTV